MTAVQTGRPFDGRVVFDHLTKTAGQAVNAWLMGLLGSGCVSPNLIGEHRELLRKHGGIYSVVSGHVFFGDGDTLDPRYRYLTLLRDPVDRALSWVSYLAHDVPVEPHTVRLINDARKFLATDGADCAPSLLDTLTEPYLRHFLPLASKELAKRDPIEAVLNVLDRYAVVGLHDQLDSFLWRVADALALPADTPLVLPAVNVSSKRLHVTDLQLPVKRHLETLLTSDLALWEQVRKRFGGPALGERRTSDWILMPQPVERTKDHRWLSVRSARVEPADRPLRQGELIEITLEVLVHRPMDELEAGFHVVAEDGTVMLGSNTSLQGHRLLDLKVGAFHLSHRFIASLPAGNYKIGAAFRMVLGGGAGGDDLYWRDMVTGISVTRREHPDSVGTVDALVSSSLLPLPERVEARSMVLDGTGAMRLNDLPPDVTAGKPFEGTAQVFNASGERWLGTPEHPLQVICQWLDSSNPSQTLASSVHEAPECGFASGTWTALPLKLVAPDAPGDYRIVPTILQVGIASLDQLPSALKPETRTIKVNAVAS